MRPSPLQSLLSVPGTLVRGMHLNRPFRPFSPAEVRSRLRIDAKDGDPRTLLVHAAAAEIGAWTHLLPPSARSERRLGLAASRLPSVVFWYRHGLSSYEIGRRLTPFGEASYGDRAIDAACALIAHRLNHPLKGAGRGGAATVRGAGCPKFAGITARAGDAVASGKTRRGVSGAS